MVVDHLLPLLGGDTSPGADQDSVVVGGVPVRMFRYSGGSPQFGVLLGSSGLLPSRKVYVSDLSDPAHEVFCCLRRDGVSLSDAYDAAQDLAGVSA